MMSYYMVSDIYSIETDFFVLESAIKYALGLYEDSELYRVTAIVQDDDSISWDYETLAVCKEDLEKLYNELV